ncbi:MAG: hypothetical protein KAU02_01535 [Tenericutes bacterium]|nr:hypothetical protein [Mycoplasmatota bacterium]
MRKVWKIVIITSIVFAIVAILSYTQLYNKSFQATVSTVGDNFIIVEGNESGYIGRYSIFINQNTKITDSSNDIILITDISEGDIVVIYYTGFFLESDPAIVENCTKIKLL